MLGAHLGSHVGAHFSEAVFIVVVVVPHLPFARPASRVTTAVYAVTVRTPRASITAHALPGLVTIKE